LHSETNKKERLPITCGLLIHILSLLDVNDPRDRNLYGAFWVLPAGLLWASETTWTVNHLIHGYTEFAQWNLTRRCIQLEEGWTLLTLPSSKTDPVCKQVTITQSASNDAACPVTAI
jgi:hypothetical protein